MSFEQLNPDKGTILIAEPFLGDPGFERSVILITDQTPDGTVGFVLNRPLNLQVQQVLDAFPDFNLNLFYGGPVQQNNLYFLHNKGHLISDSVQIGTNLYWGGQINEVKNLIANGQLKTTDIRFFLGYSGWGKNQLREEIESKTWLVAQPKFNVLSTNTKHLWKHLLEQLGGDYRLWANAPADPILN